MFGDLDPRSLLFMEAITAGRKIPATNIARPSCSAPSRTNPGRNAFDIVETRGNPALHGGIDPLKLLNPGSDSEKNYAE
jgi:hypothetical protein